MVWWREKIRARRAPYCGSTRRLSCGTGCPRFQNVISHALPFKLRFGAAGLDLKLLDGFDRDAKRKIARVALRAGAGEGNPFQIDLVLESLTAVEGRQIGTGNLVAGGN